jgi:hypothetical protein
MISASGFYWDHDHWYYVFLWAPIVGWDAGRWIQGVDLCDYFSKTPSTWTAIFNWPAKQLVVFDAITNVSRPACLNIAQFAPPGVVVA